MYQVKSKMLYSETSAMKCSNDLPLPQYQFWLNALRNDDSQQVIEVLETSDTLTKSKLLNGSFQFTEIPEVKRLAQKRPIFTHPFTLAALYGSLGVCDVMVKYDVDVFLQEKEGFNIFHCLVCIAFCQPHKEESIAQSYTKLCRVIAEENVETLLSMEDKNGLRPLEFAIHQGTLKMMLVILETPGIYKIREDIIGVSRFRWYDITEYETADMSFRRKNNISPIQLFGFLDERHFFSDLGRHVFTKSVIAEWIRKSVQSKRFVIIVWFVLKIAFCSTFCVYQLSQTHVINRFNHETSSELYRNMTANRSDDVRECDEDQTLMHISWTGKRCLEVYLILQSLTTVLYDSMVFVLGLKFARGRVSWLRDLSGKRKEISFDLPTICERSMGLFFSVVVLVEIAIYSNPTNRNVTVLTLMQLCQTPIIIITILHHMEIFQSTGHMIAYSKRMFTMATTFVMACGACVAVFTRLFAMISAADGSGGCNSPFSDISTAYYTTFMIFLNMFDVRALNVISREGLQAVHICFFFVVGVLLYNLLIAMFSDGIDKISSNKETVLCVDHLWTVGSIDNVGLSVPVFRNLYSHFKMASIRKNFACLGGKICLVVVDCARRRAI